MSHDFSRVPRAEIPRSSFDRSHGVKTTFDAGYLVPIFLDEALPGDTFNLNMTGFARLATPLHPFMDNVFMNTFFFAVPMRLVWDNWVKMMETDQSGRQHGLCHASDRLSCRWLWRELSLRLLRPADEGGRVLAQRSPA